MSSCIGKLREHVEKTGLDIPESRLKQFALLLDQQNADALTKAQFASAAEKIIGEEFERYVAKKAAADAITLAARERAVKLVADKTFGATPAENLRSWLEGGSLKVGDSVNLDPVKMKNAVFADLLQSWRRVIEPYKGIASKGILNKEIYQELWAVQNGLEPGKSGSKEALEIAKGIQAVQNQIFDLKKAYNPFMEKAEEYLIKRFHNREAVSATDKAQWVSDAMRAFGKRSFPDLPPEGKIGVFESIYERIKDGSYGSIIDDSVSDKYITVRGDGGNLMRSMARSRNLVATDWTSAYEYNLKYGYDTIEGTMMKVMSSASRDIAILDKFGPNPEGMYQGVYARTLSKLSGADRDALKGAKAALDKSFRTSTMNTGAPASGTAAKLTQGALTLEYLARTGAAWLRSLPDLQLSASLVRGLNGKTVFQNGFELAGEYVKALASSTARQQGLESFWMFSQSSRAELMREFGAPDNAPGTLGKISEKYGVLNMLQKHVDAMRSAMGTVLGKNLGDMAETAHADLPETWKNGLLRYGIGEHEWNTLRQGIEDWSSRAEQSGAPLKKFKLLTTDGVAGIPDKAIEDYLTQSGRIEDAASPEVLWLARKQLEFKLGTLINEHADLGSAHAGTRQRTFLYQGTDINDPLGMGLRLMAQFKNASVTSLDVYRRGYYSGEKMRGDWAGVAQSMAMSLFLWSIGEYTKQALEGKTPEDPTSPHFIGKALAGSGAAGVLGDILVNEADKQGIKDMVLGGLKTMAGPALGDVAEGGAIALQYGKAALGGIHEKAPNHQAGSLLTSLIPGQNLLWSKAAFNYYFANSLKEFLDPGYLGHLERGVNKTAGLLDDRQKYFMLRPTESPRW